MSSDTNVFDTTEKVDILVKTAFGFPSADESRAWYEETTVPFNDYSIGEDILIDKIPAIPDFNTNGIVRSAADIGLVSSNFVNYAATGDKSLCSIVDDSTGVIRRIRLLILDETPQLATPGASWYKLNSNNVNVIKDAFQFNYKKYTDANSNIQQPYLYKVNTQKSTISTLPFGAMGGNWFIDLKSGILFFPDFVNFSNGTQTNTNFRVNVTDNKPVLTIYTYIGRKGTPKIVDFGDDTYRNTLSAQNNQLFVNTATNSIARYSNSQWISIGGSTDAALTTIETNVAELDVSVNALILRNGVFDVSLNTKPSFSQVDVSLNAKPSFSQVDVSLNAKPSFSQVDVSLNAKPSFSQVDVSFSTYKTTVDSSFNTKPTFSQVDVSFSTYKTTVDSSFNTKPSFSQVDVSFSTYKTTVDSSFNTKPSFSQVDVSLNLKANLESPTFTGIVTAPKVISGDASFNGRVDISGVLSVTQAVNSVVTNTTINNYNVSVTNDLSLNGKLVVSSDVSFNSKLYVKGDASFGRVDICGNFFAQYPNNSIPSSAVSNGATLTYVNTSLNLKPSFSQVDTSLNLKPSFSQVDVSLSTYKTTVDSSFNTKPSFSQVDVSLNTKPTFTQVDVSLNLKPSFSQVDVSLNLKPSFSQVDTSLNLKPSFSQVDTSLNLKPSFSQVDVSLSTYKTTVDSSFNTKPSFSQVDVSFSTYKTTVDSSFNTKPSFSQVDVSLNTKPRFSQVDTSLNLKPSFSQVDVSFSTYKTTVDSSFNTKPSFSQVDVSLNTKPTYSQVDVSLNLKPSFSQVDVSLSAYKTTVDGSFNTKPSFSQVDVSLNLKSNIASPIFTGIVTAPKLTSGDTSFNGNVDISGVLSVKQTVNSVVTNTTINNYNVAVTNDLSLNGKLLVSSDVSLNSKLYVKSDASFNGRVDICGNFYAQYPAASIPSSAIIGGSSIDLSVDLSINGLTIGCGNSDISTNSVVGYQALLSNTTGRENTAFGFQALRSNTTGYQNSAVGNRALYSNTISIYNNAFGNNALRSNTGNFNNAFGSDALRNNSTGDSNNAFGLQSLFSNTTGTPNNAFGTNALFSNTTGTHNVAVGTNALYLNIIGNYNNAIGNRALYCNITGTQNNAFGWEALHDNSGGSQNSAVGYQALRSNRSGIENSAIGDNAGYNNTTGTYNTYLGANADTDAFGATWSSSTAIGANAKITASNQIMLGTDTERVRVPGKLTIIGDASFNGRVDICGNFFAQYPAASIPSSAIIGGGGGGGGSSATDISVNSLTVGRGPGTNNSTNSTLGYQALFSNTTGSQNSAVGYRALYSNTTSNGNCAFGWEALFSTNTGGQNCGFGNSALRAATTGSQNVAVGNNALMTNVNSHFNTAVGHDALTSNTSSSNSAIGYRALYINTTGTNNSAIGWQAGVSNTTGSYNTFLGNGTDTSGTTWSSSTAIGANAKITASNQITLGVAATNVNILGTINNLNIGNGKGGDVTNTVLGQIALSSGSSTGGGNTAIGYGALYINTTGQGNSAVGLYALADNTTGNNNAAISIGALRHNTTGGDNTAIGVYAGRFNKAGSSNTFLGANADVDSSGNTWSSSTAIGSSAKITASNQITLGVAATNVNILGTINTFTVGLGGGSQTNNSAVGYQALFSNTTGSGNSAFGNSALRSNTTSNSNSAVGYQALYSNTTGISNNAFGKEALRYNTTGSQNTAFGVQALYYNTTSTNNSAFGNFALLSNTTGNYNNAFGTYALYDNSGGSYNNTFGTESLRYNTTGGDNCAFGYRALNRNTTGGTNGAFGNSALFSNTTGNLNSAFGNSALYSNTTGIGNNAFGFNALYDNSGGNYNSAFGNGALRYNTTGTHNTAYGLSAGSANTTGTYNTFLGSFTDTSGTTWSSSTAIGANAKITASNQITLGVAATNVNILGTLNILGTINQLNVGRGGGGLGTNAAVGTSALIANTTGNYNSAFGVEALRANTDSAANSAFGYRALYSNIQGAVNNAFGHEALRNNTYGNYNNSFGTYALRANTTGSQNNAFGYNALYSITIGNYGTAFGHQSLNNNTANGSTAFGHNAGYNNTTGSDNTFLGINTDVSGTTATWSSSTAIGANAKITASNQITLGTASETVRVPGKLSIIGDASFNGRVDICGNFFAKYPAASIPSNAIIGGAGGGSSATDISVNSLTVGRGPGTNNSTNTAYGFQVLLLNTTGANNTAIGYQAGDTNTTGSFNTYLGAYADATGAAFSRSTAIGANALITASNQIVLGTSMEIINVPGKLSITRDASFNGNVDISGVLSVTQTVNSVVKNTTINNFNVNVTNDLSLNGKLLVSSDVSFNGKLYVKSDASFNGLLDICGNIFAPTAGAGTNTNQLATTAFVTSAVSTKANLAGPTFTGTPLAPTATAGTNTTQLATTEFVTTAVSTKANLAGPTFTGVPLAPTATAGTNTTQIATTAFVTASPSFSGVPLAPTATAGTNTTQLATTQFVTTAVSTKANLAGPTFTGVPIAPTATAGTNTTQIATTAFVTASPSFSGVPLAPTATAGTNTTQLATTQFVTTAVSTKADITYVDSSLNLKSNLASPIFTGTLTAAKITSGDASFNGRVDISGVLSVTSTLNTNVKNTTINNFNVNVTNDLSLNGNLLVSSDVSLNSRLYVKGDASFNGRVDICGNFYAQYPAASIPPSAIIGGTGGSSATDISVNSLTVGRGPGNVATNTAYGYQALLLNTTGANNTAIGYQAGDLNTTGSNNTFLGSLTDTSGTTWSNSSAIGYNAKITASNQIMLGTSAETVYVPGNASFNGNVTITDSNGTNVLLKTFSSISGIQLGQDIDGGAARDQCGYSVSISSDGTIVAIGSVNTDNYSGQVVVYKYNGTTWQQLGGVINSEAVGDFSGKSVSLSSDGTIVAIGAMWNDGTPVISDRGHVRIYKYDSAKTTLVTDQTSADYGPIGWRRLGQDIDGEATPDNSGYWVSLSSDGTTVAIGAYANDGTTGLSTDNRGHVRVYKYKTITDANWANYTVGIFTYDGGATYNKPIVANGGDAAPVANKYYWVQLGVDIDGEAAGDQSGFSVSLSADGTIVAIGANQNDAGGGSNVNCGHVRVYKYDVTKTTLVTDQASADFGPIGWRRLGQDIDGESTNDWSGFPVSLSNDGTIVAIGGKYNAGTGGGPGHVRVYKYDVTKTTLVTDQSSADYGPIGWRRLGQDIDGEAAEDQFGHSVSLSADGTTVAIAALLNDGTTGLSTDNRGHVRLYKYDSAKLTNITDQNSTDYGPIGWRRFGQDIDGKAAGDFFGWSVSLSADGKTVAIGAISNDGTTGLSTDNRGSVRVYNIQSASSKLSINKQLEINGMTIGFGNADISTNSAIGYQALNAVTSGYQNSSFGFQALTNNTTGINNSAVGYRALMSNTTGIENSAIGDSAGSNNKTGSYNIFLGANTDISGTTATWSSSSAIGANAKITASNQITLGTATEIVYVPGDMSLNGNLRTSGQIFATNFSSTSDYRIKDYVTSLSDCSFTIDKLRPVSYHNKMTNKPDIGLIAHEVQEHFPFLVSGEKDGDAIQSVNYTGLIGILIHEIQQLKQETIPKLNQTIKLLEERVQMLES